MPKHRTWMLDPSETPNGSICAKSHPSEVSPLTTPKSLPTDPPRKGTPMTQGLETLRSRPHHLDYWQLREEPFRPELRWPADRTLLYHSRGWEEALARVQYVSDHQFGLALLTGPSGAGKSLLMRAAAEQLALNGTRPLLHVCPPACEGGAKLNGSADPLGRPVSAQTRQVLRACLFNEPTLLTEARYALMLDDAHWAAQQPGCLEQLLKQAVQRRQLGCLILSVPQAEATSLFEQFAGQAPLLIRIPALLEWESIEYLTHRYAAVGGNQFPFDEEAAALLHLHAEGMPRQLNRLAHECLLLATLRELTHIPASLVEEIARTRTPLLTSTLKSGIQAA